MVAYEKKMREWYNQKNGTIRDLLLEKQDAEIRRMSTLDELKIVTKYFSDLELSYQELFK